MRNYECHITMKDVTDIQAAALDLMAKLSDGRWKTSHIVGDPVLGDFPFYYLTSHDSEFDRIDEEVSRMVKTLTDQNYPVCRWKIEQILVDERIG